MTAAAFWDKISEGYSKSPIKDTVSYEATLDRVRHWITPDMRGIELGCGTGSTAVKLAPDLKSLTGTDFSAQMIRIAQEKAQDIDNLTFQQQDAGDAMPDAPYDLAMCFNLLHLVEDIDQVLAQVHGALHDGGLFISKTPCLSRKHLLRPLVWGMQVVGKAPRPVHFFSPEYLEVKLRAAGFEILETGGYPKSLPNHLIVARRT
jgi:2-polyprenyl-3-methyl-5-hydroxy-6-metoxy-1,4-benzoquinol methylase